MSCCGGKCGCGSTCKCGNGCSGCGMYPGLDYSEAAGETTQAVILGVSSQKINFEGAEMGVAENGCKCGANCNCDPCSCK
ncbi:hypothetical protein CASFOL_027682 [Castilleja foliolosa]|uniref:Metallothionein-like protein n=1 Tax=Castilleja foliolosa TaxID=1961234 RepID=A0ABD3CH27_9LAMI